MYTLVIFIVCIGILIFVHEFGHFIAARIGGIRVLKFSLGFGPRLIGRKIGDTEYLISALPLGGYVKMAGENATEETSMAPDEFSSKNVSTRAFVVLSGPLMNIIIAFLLMPLVFFVGIKMPAYLEKPPVVGWVEEGSPADVAGIEMGDSIIEVEGKSIDNWNSLVTALTTHPMLGISMKIQRDGVTKDVFLERLTESQYGNGYAGIFPPMPPVIGKVKSGYPAERAGIRDRDIIVAMDGIPVKSWYQVSSYIRAHVDQYIDITVKRGEETITLPVKPVLEEAVGYGVIGIINQQKTIIKKYGFLESVRYGFSRMLELTALTFDVLKRLVSLNLSIEALGGPIMIAKLTGEAAQSGLSDLLAFLAFMSLQLGILNLIPVPVLDGGWIVFLIIEKIKGSPLSRKTMEVAQTIGFALLITLIIIVSYNDILRVFR